MSADLRLPAVVACCAIGFAVTASAEESAHSLTIRTVDVDAPVPTGVKSTIMMRSSAGVETQFAPIGSNGVYQAASFDCEPGISFRAVPQTMIYVASNDWQACAYPEIVFQFTRSAYAARIDHITTFAYTRFATANPQIAVLGDKLAVAVETNALGDVPILATELAAKLDDVGERKLAADAVVVGYAAATAVLGETKPLPFDPAQKKYVLSPTTVDALKTFQVDNNLVASGRIDWHTMGAFSSRYGNNIAGNLYGAADSRM